MTVPAANPMTPEKIALGRALFFDATLSADGKVSCATCHQVDHGFAESRAIAHGVHDVAGARNSPTLVNAGYSQTLFWDGRAQTLEEQVMGPILNPKEMGLTAADLERKSGHTAQDVANALASYVRTIRSRESRYDWYQAGQTSMLSEQERAGLDLFRQRGCGTCHSGPRFTDDGFHNTGIGWDKGTYADLGRFEISHDERDRGAFKTPTLRDIALTAPYMHDGSVPTLEAVVEFYSQGGRPNPALDRRLRPERFTAEESRALLAFLRALTGRLVEGS
jgi:cytochrome c peroxidase